MSHGLPLAHTLPPFIVKVFVSGVVHHGSLSSDLLTLS